MPECLILFAWLASPGILLGYEIKLDGQVVNETTMNHGEICIEDDQIHTIQIIAIGWDGSRRPGELFIGTRDEMIAAQRPEPEIIKAPLAPHPSIPQAADFSCTGTVNFDDFGEAVAAFGATSDRMVGVEGCPSE